MDRLRSVLKAVENLAVVERGKRLLGIGEACAERILSIRAEDTQVPQREVLEVHLGLAEVEIQQEFDGPRAVESDEFPGAAVLRGRRKGDLFEIIVDELGFGPGLTDVFAPSRLCTTPWPGSGRAPLCKANARGRSLYFRCVDCRSS